MLLATDNKITSKIIIQIGYKYLYQYNDRICCKASQAALNRIHTCYEIKYSIVTMIPEKHEV